MTSEKRIERIETLLEALLANRSFDTAVPLPLREVALICHVATRTLQGWIDQKKIKGHRPCDGAPWRVFPKDVAAYLMAETNMVPARRKRVLRMAA
jgi:hypothetical protein